MHVREVERLFSEEERGSEQNGNGAATEPPIGAYPYGVEDGRIVRYQTVKENSTISVPLCNFDAEIKEEKSSLAALILNHFGEFNRVTLPGNWESTANQLERRAFLLKDSLFVIDEYVPTGLNRREIETKASRILRGQGNLSGRNRLKSDLTERLAFYPRGIIISTGEEHPPGQSLLARTIVIELSRDDIDIDLLTALQQQADRFAHAMSGYISWLAPQMDNLPRLLKETFLGTRARATTGNEHLRIPEAAAHLWLGVHSALIYAEEIGAVGYKEAAEILDGCWGAFIQIGKDQAVLVEEEQPVRRFLGVLHTMVTQGRAIIKDKSEVIPDPKQGIDFVGWRDTDYLYLLPEATFQAVARFCHDTHDHLPRSDRLKRDLKKDGISECDEDRLTRRVNTFQGFCSSTLAPLKRRLESRAGHEFCSHLFPLFPLFYMEERCPIG